MELGSTRVGLLHARAEYQILERTDKTCLDAINIFEGKGGWGKEGRNAGMWPALRRAIGDDGGEEQKKSDRIRHRSFIDLTLGSHSFLVQP